MLLMFSFPKKEGCKPFSLLMEKEGKEGVDPSPIPYAKQIGKWEGKHKAPQSIFLKKLNLIYTE